MVRFSQVVIVLFWLASVAWLCVEVWSPPGSRMSAVDPREVYRVFFSWNDSTNMTLLENGVRRGQVTVLGGSGEDAETGRFERVVSVSGSLENYDERSASYLVSLFWKGSFAFTGEMEGLGGEFSVRIPSRELTAQLLFEDPEGGVKAKVSMAGRELLNLDSASFARGGPNPAEAATVLTGLLGLAGGGEGLASLDPSKMRLSVSARSGDFNLAGRNLRAFLLTLRSEEQGRELRVFLSEVGEPLRIETDFGFEAVSEILVPLDAYKHPSPPEKK